MPASEPPILPNSSLGSPVELTDTRSRHRDVESGLALCVRRWLSSDAFSRGGDLASERVGYPAEARHPEHCWEGLLACATALGGVRSSYFTCRVVQ